MKITICGSIAFLDEMQDIKQQLEELGHEVEIPPLEIPDKNGAMISAKELYKIRKSANQTDAWVWERKADAIQKHFDKVVWSDAILVLNYDKNNIPYYIGANTLLEMGLAFHLKKKIFLLHPIPEISYQEEVCGMHPTVIHEDLSRIV